MPEVVRLFSLQIALIAVVLVLHTYIGLHIIRRTLIFSDLVLDQLAAFGALVGVAVGISYASPASYILAFAAVLLGAFLLAVLNPKGYGIPREAVIGILYAMALVVSLLLTDKIENGQALVEKTLSGYLLWVSAPLVAVTAGVYILLIIFHYCSRDKFIALAESPELLKNERLWDFLLFTTQGIVTVLIVPIAGVLLAYAFLMIPAAIATLFTKKWIPAVVLGWTVGFTACLAGLISSYHFSLPYGPTLVLFMGAAFAGALVLRYVLGRRSRITKKGLQPCRS
ncbi:MAG: metal ABC transporter permease [Sedimentisphaerales bacterium]|nr:metal ABC transporter permease [Sedimentisphaerales bacterium]